MHLHFGSLITVRRAVHAAASSAMRRVAATSATTTSLPPSAARSSLGMRRSVSSTSLWRCSPPHVSGSSDIPRGCVTPHRHRTSVPRTAALCTAVRCSGSTTTSPFGCSPSAPHSTVVLEKEEPEQPDFPDRVQEYSRYALPQTPSTGEAKDVKQEFYTSHPETMRSKVYRKDFQRTEEPKTPQTPSLAREGNEEAKKERKDEELIRMWRETPNNPALSPRHPPPADVTAETMNATQRRQHPSLSQPSPQAFAALRSSAAPDSLDKASVDAAQTASSFQDVRPSDPNESVESLQKRLHYQSQYRGMVEMDLICGHFARTKIHTLNKSQLQQYDQLLKHLDNDLFKWMVMGETAPPEVESSEVFQMIKKFIAEERTELLGHY